MPVAAPQVSVMPQTSSMGTPSARYQLTRSGEIGAAPVTQKARAVDADHLAHVVQHQQAREPNCTFSSAGPAGRPARQSATSRGRPMAQA